MKNRSVYGKQVCGGIPSCNQLVMSTSAQSSQLCYYHGIVTVQNNSSSWDIRARSVASSSRGFDHDITHNRTTDYWYTITIYIYIFTITPKISSTCSMTHTHTYINIYICTCIHMLSTGMRHSISYICMIICIYIYIYVVEHVTLLLALKAKPYRFLKAQLGGS